MEIREYIKNIAKQQSDIAEKLAKIRADIEEVANDVESNAQAIEEETGDLAVGNTLEMLNELGVDTDDQ